MTFALILFICLFIQDASPQGLHVRNQGRPAISASPLSSDPSRPNRIEAARVPDVETFIAEARRVRPDIDFEVEPTHAPFTSVQNEGPLASCRRLYLMEAGHQMADGRLTGLRGGYLCSGGVEVTIIEIDYGLPTSGRSSFVFNIDAANLDLGAGHAQINYAVTESERPVVTMTWVGGQRYLNVGVLYPPHATFQAFDAQGLARHLAHMSVSLETTSSR